jgi:uncharacterized alkaline shock family protein YloU
METKMNEENYLEGKTTIAPDVLLTITRLTALNVKGVSRLAPVPAASRPRWMQHGHLGEGIAIEIVDNVFYADIYLVLASDMNVRQVSRNVQQEIVRAVSEMVGMTVGRINVHIEDIDYPAEAGD